MLVQRVTEGWIETCSGRVIDNGLIKALIHNHRVRMAHQWYVKSDHIEQRDARWVPVDLSGKGKRIRTVPVPAWNKVAIDQWLAASRIGGGRLLRAVRYLRIEQNLTDAPCNHLGLRV